MDAIRVESAGSVAVVRLSRGVTNPIDLRLLEELERALHEAVGDPEVRGLVLTSTNAKFFSLGWDLPTLIELDRTEFRAFFDTHDRVCIALHTLPLPTVAALTGHAVAGGCLLSLACDWRLVAEGRKLMGLNEVKLGVPIPWAGDRILRQVLGERVAREVTEGGELFPAEASVAMGLVDRVLPLDDVEPAAIELATRLGASPRGGFRALKYNRTRATITEIHEHSAEKAELFLDCWFADETRELLRAAVEKF